MIEKIKVLLKELGVAVEFSTGRDMTEVVEAKAKADRRETAVLFILAGFSVADALLIFIVGVEGWVAAILSGVILVGFFISDAHFAKQRTLLKFLRKTIELGIGNKIRVALAVIKIGDIGDVDTFVLVTRVVHEDPQRSVYDFEFRLLNLQAVLLVLQDLFDEDTASSRFVVVYALGMQAASLATFKDGPAGLLIEEMANALGVKPVPINYI